MRVQKTANADTNVPSEASVEKSESRGSIGVKRTPELEAAIGARLRAARIAAHMSQGDLGAVVGISFQQVQKYERGADRIAASTLQGFAGALGVHPGAFYGDEMPVPSGDIPDVKAAMRIAKAVQSVRNSAVLKQLLSLIEALAEDQGADVEQPGPPPSHGTP